MTERSNPDFVLTQTFHAPRALLWNAWTKAEHLQRWFSPPGMTLPVCKVDLRPGGTCHYCMRMANGHEMWGQWRFVEIAAPERLVMITTFSDAQGGVTRHPMVPTWPLQTLSTTTFVERDGRTEMTLRWAPHEASAEEKLIFDNSHPSMQMGWAGTIAQLTDYLAKAQAGAAGGAQN